MITCSMHGPDVVHVTFWGILTWKVCDPLCMVLAVDPAGKPSARTGCVVDQTGLVIIAGVHCATVCGGSGRVVSVWLALFPWCSEIRYHPGCGTVAVTETETMRLAGTDVIMFVGVPTGSPNVPPFAAQGPSFWGPPVESCDIQLAGAVSLKCARAAAGANIAIVPSVAATVAFSLGIRALLASCQ
jgi:hypothetical protein